jgi:hypothetical protein
MQLLKALPVGLHELQFLRKAERNSLTRVALAGQRQQTLFRRFLNVLMKSFETTDRLQPERLQMSSRYIRKCEQHWHLCIFKTVCTMGSTKPDRLSQNHAERGVLRFAFLLQGWWWRLFVTDRHWRWTMTGSLWTADRTIVSRTVSSNTSLQKNLKATPSAGKVMATVSFGEGGGIMGCFW